MTDKPLGSREVIKEGRELVDNIQNKVSELLEVLEDIDNILDVVDRDRVIFAAAFDFTYRIFEEKAFDFLLNQAKQAIISSVEYNYPPFISQFLTALTLNYNNTPGMIQININSEQEEIIGVDIDLSSLGDVEIYAQAVKSARDKLGVSKASAVAASDMWREKIYGVAREGVRVFKRFKGQIVRRSQEFLLEGESEESHYGDTGEEGGEEKDITDRYINKYHDTIIARLQELGDDQAPFWEIIENGNAGLSMSSNIGEGAYAYPSVEPTGFIRNTELAIFSAFYDTFRIYKEEAALYLGGLIAENFGLEGFTGSVKDLPKQIKEEIKERLLGTAIVSARETNFQGALDYIDTAIGRMHLYVTSRGNLKITVQDRTTKRWVSPSLLLGL